MNEEATETQDSVALGGLTIDRELARTEAAKYLSGTGGYGYPAYDAFEAGAGPDKLSDGDFLAPALLNVTVRIPAFYSLVAARDRLEAWLGRVPNDARLVDAGPEELELLGELFTVLDDGLPGVGGTTLAKIMHRKRPAFVPLHYRYIWWCYVGADASPIPRVRDRTWAEYMQLPGAAMKHDVELEAAWLTQIAELAAGPVPITTLRALDIVAWRAAQKLDTIDPETEDDGPRASAAE